MSETFEGWLKTVWNLNEIRCSAKENPLRELPVVDDDPPECARIHDVYEEEIWGKVYELAYDAQHIDSYDEFAQRNVESDYSLEQPVIDTLDFIAKLGFGHCVCDIDSLKHELVRWYAGIVAREIVGQNNTSLG